VSLLNQIKRLLYKTIKFRVWFASITVILLFLLLALTVNTAREKDIVEIFSRQQLAHVQDTATRMKDVFFPGRKEYFPVFLFRKSKNVTSEKFDDDLKNLYSGWENTLDEIVFLDEAGKIKKYIPKIHCLPSRPLSIFTF